MAKPNFLIVGAAKSGTTSLYNYLKQHPQVFMPDRKEPSFFVEDIGLHTWEDYQALFAPKKQQLAVGEASIAYLYDELAPAKIYECLGDATKIVIILRNPVDMAYSLWGHMMRVGGESLPLFEAIQAEPQRMADKSFAAQCRGWVYNYAYTDRAKYANQVKRYLDQFGSNNVKILVYEQFFSQPQFHYVDLCEFLNVNTNFSPTYKTHNPAGVSRFKVIRTILNDSYVVKDYLKKFIPTYLRSKIKSTLNQLNRKNIPLPPLTPEQRITLWSYFENDVAELEKYIKKSLYELWCP